MIRSGFERVKDKPGSFFTYTYLSAVFTDLLVSPPPVLPDDFVETFRLYLNSQVAAGRIKSYFVQDVAASTIKILLSHNYGELNADIHKIGLEAVRTAVVKFSDGGLLKKGLAALSSVEMVKAVQLRWNEHSITERPAESVGLATIVGGSLGAVNIKLFHEFAVPGSTPLQKLGLSKAPGFLFVVRKMDDIIRGDASGKEWRFEISHPSKNESIPLLALASQTNDYVITAVYPVDGGSLPPDEPVATVADFLPVFDTGGKRLMHPSILYRSQSGADAVGGIGSILEDVNFVPGGPEGKCFVATKPVSLEEARGRPPDGIAFVSYVGWQSHISGRIPPETIVDHVGLNPPAVRPERKLADQLAAVMTDHKEDQPYLAPFAAEEHVERLRREQEHLFTRSPKETEPDDLLDEVERRVRDGRLITVTDDKADMGGTWGHTQVPTWMTAIYKATMLEAQEKGELTFGNTFGCVDGGRLRDNENWGVGDDGHMIMMGDKSPGGANSHQLSFLAFTRAYLFSSANQMKPYGEGQDFQGAEAKAAKNNPYFYSKFTPRFFELLREFMPPKYLNMVTDLEDGEGPKNVIERVEKGWLRWRETGQSAQVLNEPFSGNVSQQGIGSARYFLDPEEEKTVEALAGDKMGPSALNRVIREAAFAAVDSGSFANGLVFEVWDAKAFGKMGRISPKDFPPSLTDLKLLAFKSDENKKWVYEVYKSGAVDPRLSDDDRIKLGEILKQSGYVPCKRVFLDVRLDREPIIKYLADSDRFNVKHVWQKKISGWDANNPKKYLDRPILASSITRLGILTGGEYVGKDDPVMLGHAAFMRFVREFLRDRPIIIQGDMNGSHWLWAIPTALRYGVATKDSHPILVMLRYHVSANGKGLSKVEDLTGGEEFDAIRDKALQFNRDFKKAQLGGQFEPLGTNVRTVEGSYELAKILRELNRDDSPYLIANKIGKINPASPLIIPAVYGKRLYEAVLGG